MIDLFNEADKPLMTEPFSGPQTGKLKALGLALPRGVLQLAKGAAPIAALPFPSEDDATYEQRQAEFEEAQATGAEGADRFPSKEDFYRFAERRLDPAINYLTPDPETLTGAGRVVSALGELPGMLVGGPTGIIYGPAMNIGTDLVKQGVDPATATVAGVGTAAAMGAAVALPAAGQTIKQTIALALSNPVIGAAQDFATKKFIEGRGYQDQAQMFDPLDPAARSVDLVLGVLFGGIAQYAQFRQRAPQAVVDAIDAVDVHKNQQAASPFDPADKTASRAHTDALQKAAADLDAGRPVDVTDQLKASAPEPATKSYAADAFRADAQKVFGLSDEQADAAVALVAARAKVQGEDVDAYISKRIAGVVDGTDQAVGALYQGREIVQPFYSKVLSEVEGLTQEKWSGEQLLGKLRKTPGVKAEELAWTGLDEFLAGKKSVTREEVAQYMRENQVQIKEVTLGHQKKEAADRALMEFRRRGNHSGLGPGEINDLEISLWRGDPVEIPGGMDQVSADLVRALRERDAAENEGTGRVKFEGYTLPGGENYRELLLTMPFERSGGFTFEPDINSGEWVAYLDGNEMGRSKNLRELREGLNLEPGAAKQDANLFRSGHFDQPNILAHIRYNERTGPAGERILHIEEVQSDWHQKGRDAGYDNYKDDRPLAEVKKELETVQAQMTPHTKNNDPLAVREKQLLSIIRGGVPDAPFKKTWHELAMRRAVRHAAEHGFDRLTWTTGEQQAARYDLSKTFDTIRYDHDGAMFKIMGQTTDGAIKEFGRFTAEQLPDAIGKDLSSRMLEDANAGKKYSLYSGENLKIGGEGMRGFYDRMLPQYMNKLGKKFGAQVETAKIENGKRTATQRRLEDLQQKYHAETDVSARARLAADMKAEDQELRGMEDALSVHSLPITDAMRDSLLYEGQPLFQGEKGAVSFLNDGRALIHALDAPDFSTLVHELAHVLEADLSKFERAHLDTWLHSQIPGAKWSTPQRELFARTFERYLAEGKAPDASLQGVFEKMRSWLLEVYKRISGTAIDVKLAPKVREQFDRMLFTERMKKDVAPEVQQARIRQQEQADELIIDLVDMADDYLPAAEQFPIADDVPHTGSVSSLIESTIYPRVTSQAERSLALEAIDATLQDYEHPRRLLFRSTYVKDMDRHPDLFEVNKDKVHTDNDGNARPSIWFSTSLENARALDSYRTDGPSEIIAVDLGAIPAKVYMQNVRPPGDLDYAWIGIPNDIAKSEIYRVAADGTISKKGGTHAETVSKNDLGRLEEAQTQRRVSSPATRAEGRAAQSAAGPFAEFGNDGGYGLPGSGYAEANPALAAFARNPENVSRVLADLLEAEATALEQSRSDQMAADGHALNGRTSDAPPWFIELNRSLAESAKAERKAKKKAGDDSPTPDKMGKKSVVNAMRAAANGQYSRLTEGQKQAVMHALESLAETSQQYRREIDINGLQIGDRYTQPDLQQRVVVGERGGTLLLDDGSALDSAGKIEVLGDIDSSARTEQMPESAADYYLREMGDKQMDYGTDRDGQAVSRSAVEILNEARAEVAKTQAQEHLYQRAALCLRLG